MRLQGKTVFITAAGQGIGRAIAEAAIHAGGVVTATDIKGALLDGLHCTRHALDVTNGAAVREAVGAVNPDILINCAGIVHSGTILEATDEEFDFATNLNIRSMMHTIKAALPAMRERKAGAIVNIASVASSVMGVPNRFIYSTTKAGVVGLTMSVARDFVAEGIRCNCICPGTVDSPSLHERLRATGDYEGAMQAFVARQPMGRIAEASEIADLAIYLASDESRYMTGQAVVIDGGMSL